MEQASQPDTGKVPPGSRADFVPNNGLASSNFGLASLRLRCRAVPCAVCSFSRVQACGVGYGRLCSRGYVQGMECLPSQAGVQGRVQATKYAVHCVAPSTGCRPVD
jgi:hypothetical protein